MVMRQRRSTFTFMVVGRSGLGKSTFINTLLDKEITNGKSDDINMYVLDIDCEGVQKRITAIDTPGFGKGFNDLPLHENITNFIKLQFDKYLAEETKVKRNPRYEDTRIHCLLYFIAPSIYGMKETDIAFLKKASELVNIIPVIAKGDALTSDEKKVAKNVIIKQLQENEIKIFDVEGNGGINRNCLTDKVPFTVICSQERIRKYRWGNAETDNIEHCDFQLLKELILSSHAEILVDSTDLDLYENYRTVVLCEMLPGALDEENAIVPEIKKDVE